MEKAQGDLPSCTRLCSMRIDRIELFQWDTATPTNIYGTVDDVGVSSLEFTLDSAWGGTSAGDKYVIRYAIASDATGVSTAQKRFAFYANDLANVGFASGAVDAYRISP